MRMKIRNITGLVLAALSAVCINGCVEEMDVHVTDSEQISFTAVLPAMTRSGNVERSMTETLYEETRDWGWDAYMESPKTKGLPLMQLEGNAGVTAYQYDGEWKGTETSWSGLTNADYTFDGNALIGEMNRWSDVRTENLRVYAYAPYISAAGAGTISGSQTITVTVAGNVEDQIDIIAAENDVKVADAKGNSIPLTFDHILTAVRFRAGFECTVKYVSVSGIYGKGTYTLGSGWDMSGATPDAAYSVGFSSGKEVGMTDMITDDKLTMMLLPQALPEGAEVSMTYVKDGNEKTITASLNGRVWESGKMITYTLYEKESQSNYIYFDLAAGDVSIGYVVEKNGTITNNSVKRYSGYVYVNGEKQTVTGNHVNDNIYYVYQSTGDVSGDYDKTKTGWIGAINNGECIIPDYKPVMDGAWADYITNNSVVEDVIHKWAGTDGKGGEVAKVGRTVTNNRIHVSGPIVCHLTIDDIYSNYQINSQSRRSGSLAYIPSGSTSKLLVNMVGDNRLGCVHYSNGTRGNQLIFEGVGSLTVADADYNTVTWNSLAYIGVPTSSTNIGAGHYVSNHWNSAIGNCDSSDNSIGIVINSGVVYAGTTKAENCTAIGAGGNGLGVVTINGGNVTAVAATTGTAIGGGIGFKSTGGKGEVTITGGNVYAYNHANRWDIPSAAIGGAGSSDAPGDLGTVTITGGNVYAQTALGTAIGGGSSRARNGGNAIVKISGGNVIAKSLGTYSELKEGRPWIDAGAGIGGGTGCSGGSQSSSSYSVNGGDATIEISGNAVIKTGSIGGGKSGHTTRGNIGTATIKVSGGDIQAQFVMAGSVVANSSNFKSPEFTMTGGIIRNSNTADSDFYHIVPNGGAVYMEDGVFTMNGGTISECTADYGGAVYIKKGAKSTTLPAFRMSAGTISKCSANYDGGAVYIEDGTIQVSGSGTIQYCSAGTTGSAFGRGGAVCVRKTGSYSPSFTMTGGKLLSNTAIHNGGALHLEGGEVVLQGGQVVRNVVLNGNGGGISINSGSFTMPVGGTALLNANSAHSHDDDGGKGGGVFVTSLSEAVNVNLLSGSIIGNSSAQVGGGIGVDLSDAEVESVVTVGNPDDPDSVMPDISGNLTLKEGGGLYVNGALASIIINSGKIVQNSTAGYVDNPDVVNVTGKVTLNGGHVKSNDVTYDGNGGHVKDDADAVSHVQRIVTDTNNILSIPTFFRNGYRLVGWNTRADGLGASYTNGQTVKRSTDLTLYAIWELE